MSFWKEHDIESKVLDILRDVVPVSAGRGSERPFQTAYQLAIEFARRHPEALAVSGWTVGGARSGKGYSLAQYLASNLARYVRDHPGGSIERVFLSNRQVNDLSFLHGEEIIHSSVTATSPTLALYRLREAGEPTHDEMMSPYAEVRAPDPPIRVEPATEIGRERRANIRPVATSGVPDHKHTRSVNAIAQLAVDDWRDRVSRSNKAAMKKRHQYPPQEGAFLRRCCVYQAPTCDEGCFCRTHGNDGGWTLRPDLDFQTFFHFYGQLWIGVQHFSFEAAVDDERRETRARWATGVKLLRGLKARWSDWDGAGRSLPALANGVRRCFFCDDAFDLIAPFVDEIRGLCDDDSGVYTSKLVSQLFYDIAVPFDTGSKGLQNRAGYEPTRYGGGAMQRDVQDWLVAYGLSIAEFRQLDDAPVRYWRADDQPMAMRGTACSRVLDKLFYG